MPYQPEQEPQPLADLLSPGVVYETPSTVGVPAIRVGERAGGIIIRFELEGGYVLDIPMTKETRARLSKIG